jgi:hypothetical protein
LGLGGFSVEEGRILLGQVFTRKMSSAQAHAGPWAALGHRNGLQRRMGKEAGWAGFEFKKYFLSISNLL